MIGPRHENFLPWDHMEIKLTHKFSSFSNVVHYHRRNIKLKLCKQHLHSCLATLNGLHRAAFMVYLTMLTVAYIVFF
jgi:hypothetical protein